MALTLGEKVREKRTVLGIGQAELAKMCNVSPTFICMIEHNRNTGLSLVVAQSIARCLGIKINALVGDNFKSKKGQK